MCYHIVMAVGRPGNSRLLVLLAAAAGHVTCTNKQGQGDMMCVNMASIGSLVVHDHAAPDCCICMSLCMPAASLDAWQSCWNWGCVCMLGLLRALETQITLESCSGGQQLFV